MGENNTQSFEKEILKKNSHLVSHFPFILSTSPKAQGHSVLYKFRNENDSESTSKANISLLHASTFHSNHLLTIKDPVPFFCLFFPFKF